MIGIIGAMDLEINALIKQLECKKETRIGMDIFYDGILANKPVVLSVCGPGKVNAAICTQNMITCFHPEAVINMGVAGAGNDLVNVGDMVVATAAVQHDMDTSPIGDPIGYISKIGMTEVPCDAVIREKLVNAARKLEHVHVFQGIIATGDQFISDAKRRSIIHERFDACAVEMEGGAVAHVCYANNVPCGILRSLSDKANGEAEMDYPTFAAMAAEHAQLVIKSFLKEY